MKMLDKSRKTIVWRHGEIKGKILIIQYCWEKQEWNRGNVMIDVEVQFLRELYTGVQTFKLEYPVREGGSS